MKKLLFGVAALMLMASCAGNGSNDKVDENADATEQSAQVEETTETDQDKEAEALEAEKEAAANDAAFEKAVNGLGKIDNYSKGKLDKYLKGLGFKGSWKSSTKKEYNAMSEAEIDVNIVSYKYEFTAGDKTIKFNEKLEEDITGGSCTIKVSIEGDDEALSSFYKTAKKLGDQVSKKGNTVTITTGWL